MNPRELKPLLSPLDAKNETKLAPVSPMPAISTAFASEKPRISNPDSPYVPKPPDVIAVLGLFGFSSSVYSCVLLAASPPKGFGKLTFGISGALNAYYSLFPPKGLGNSGILNGPSYSLLPAAMIKKDYLGRLFIDTNGILL